MLVLMLIVASVEARLCGHWRGKSSDDGRGQSSGRRQPEHHHSWIEKRRGVRGVVMDGATGERSAMREEEVGIGEESRSFDTM